MILAEAMLDIADKLEELNRREQACGLRRLAEQDKTDGEWAMELQARVNLIAADGATQDNLDALGALVIARKVALGIAEEARIESGDAA